MALTIRARLTLWYSFVMLATLAATAVLLSAVHARLGQHRIDRVLAGNLVTAATWIDREADLGLDIHNGVEDALAELELPGSGVAVMDEAGRLLGERSTGAPLLTGRLRQTVRREPQSFRLSDGSVRALAASHAHDGQIINLVVWTSLAPLDAERATVRRTLWIVMPAGLLFAAVGGWVIGWRSLAPLSSMARQANAIDDRSLDARLAVPSAGDELSALAVAFNNLLERLTIALQAQRRFMADASHQLRTPLSIARIAAQVTLGQQERSQPEYRESLETIAQQTERLTRMVDDMFQLALADLDARPLQLEEVYLNEIVNECVAAARILARGRSVDVRASTPDDVQVQADENLLRQMILNLVENAVRHTPPGGSVQVALEADGARATIAVSDTGTGIAPRDRERIFERFVQLEAAVENGGGGLGLPIARWVADLHGGTLALESTGPAGSRFVAVLPVR